MHYCLHVYALFINIRSVSVAIKIKHRPKNYKNNIDIFKKFLPVIGKRPSLGEFSSCLIDSLYTEIPFFPAIFTKL
jgi:hypothetical protein